MHLSKFYTGNKTLSVNTRVLFYCSEFQTFFKVYLMDPSKILAGFYVCIGLWYLKNNTLSISTLSPYIFALVLKVRFCYTKFMLLYINQGLAETLHAISFKNDCTSLAQTLLE